MTSTTKKDTKKAGRTSGLDDQQQAVLPPSERASVPAAEDPALVAGKEAAEAEAAFNAIPGSTPADEDTPLFKAAQERMEAADAAFADAPITSAAGAFAKMRAIVDIGSGTLDGPHLETRHFKTVFVFLEAVVGGKAAAIGGHPDADLLARVAEFYPALEKHNIASEAWDAGRAEADAMPDCPPLVAPAFDKAGHDRWKAFMTAKGVDRLCKKSNAAGRAMGKAANRVFAIRARTYEGAVEKVKIAYIAIGDGEGTGTGDDDLETYQDIESPWMANAIADFERLAGPAAAALPEPDPAVAALAEYRVAKAADDAISDKDAAAETPEYKATGDRVYAARDAVYEAVPTSLAGVGAKIRFLFDHQERGNDLWPAFDYTAKSMLPFLEGGAAAAPDPVVTLFAKWGAITEEVMVLSAAMPEDCGKGGMVPGKPWVKEGEIPWEDALTRRDAVEGQIMLTPATSMQGVAVKIRIASHYIFEAGDFDQQYATPSRDIDYVEGNGGPLSADQSYAISALRDAERLAGVS